MQKNQRALPFKYVIILLFLLTFKITNKVKYVIAYLETESYRIAELIDASQLLFARAGENGCKRKGPAIV